MSLRKLGLDRFGLYAGESFRFLSVEERTLTAEVSSMTNLQRRRILAAISVLLPVVTPAQEHETEIQRSELPPAVEKAVGEHSMVSTINGFSQEEENWQTFYEAELIVNGHSKDVLRDKNWLLVEEEEWVSMESLLPAAREGLRAKASGEIVKVEMLTQRGRIAAYEAKVLTNDKKSEDQVEPDGPLRLLGHELRSAFGPRDLEMGIAKHACCARKRLGSF